MNVKAVLLILVIFLATGLMETNRFPGTRYLLYSRRLTVPEPSGLVLGDRNTLWTVSDHSGDLYQLDVEGNLIHRISFDGGDLEGITLVDSFFYVLQEQGMIRKVDFSGNTVETFSIELSSSNKTHLEGITFNSDNRHFYLLNEKNESLLLECDESFRVLTETVLDDADDYSGLTWDAAKNGLWMLSHESRSLMFWDLKTKQTTSSLKLDIEQAEGVALDPVSQRIYIVGDEDRRLFVYGYRMEVMR